MTDPRTDEGLMLAYQAGGRRPSMRSMPAIARLYRYLVHQCGEAKLAEGYQDIWLRVVKARADYQPLASFPLAVPHRPSPLDRSLSAPGRRPGAAAGCQERCGGRSRRRELSRRPLRPPPAQLERLQLRARIDAALAALPAPQRRETFLLAGRLD